MRFKINRDKPNESRKPYEKIIRKTFAFFPIIVKDEVRWLEFVKIKGYWWKGASGTWRWEPECFID